VARREQSFDVTKAPTVLSATVTPTAPSGPEGSVAVNVTRARDRAGYPPTGSVTITDSIGKTVIDTLVVPFAGPVPTVVLKKVSFPMNTGRVEQHQRDRTTAMRPT